MIIEILTIFPEIFDSSIKFGLLEKALAAGIVQIHATDIRDFATDQHRTVDDTPFGGGAGMVMKVEPLDRALKHLKKKYAPLNPKIILTSASGIKFDQKKAEHLSREELLIIICGRYKGIDERILSLHAIEEISLGDFVLSGGEYAALAIGEAVVRLLPGYMGKQSAAVDDSFTWGILGFPVYTQPQDYHGLKVPEVLVSGHHERIRIFRRSMALKKTLKVRPELMRHENLTDEDKKLLSDLEQSEGSGP